jgi:fumarate hydratase class II
MEEDYRIETDSLGEVKVPAGVYYGAQTQRAKENFPISGDGFPPQFIRNLGLVKYAAAMANEQIGLLDNEKAAAIKQAALEIARGKLTDQFVVDIYQTGSGTSTNMNANEVIARRAGELLGECEKGEKIHPNDHVNLCQSSNDVMPSVLHISAALEINKKLLPALGRLSERLAEKEEEFAGIVKPGRTHLQDATPVRFDQVFSGYRRRLDKNIARLNSGLEELKELALGGTAVGTGLNCHPDFVSLALKVINKKTGLDFVEAENHFEAQNSREAVLSVSSLLKNTALALQKIGSDIRWLATGPRCGLNELKLEAQQPGSSIMPGKVNPVIIESLLQVVARINGNDSAISHAAFDCHFELNTMLPVMADSLLESIGLLTNAANNFSERCVAKIQVNRKRCQQLLERNLSLATALASHIGYDRAASLAKKALNEDKTIKQVVLEENLMEEEELDSVLDPVRMTEEGFPE